MLSVISTPSEAKWISMKPLFILSALLALAACSSVPTTAGRFLQAMHPTAGVLVLQLTLPTPEQCAMALKSMATGNDNARAVRPTTSCQPSSLSQQLPFIATMRDKTGDYTFDVEVTQQIVCDIYVSEVLKAGNGATELVAPCRKKS